jgi:hypothetical protein
MNLRGATDGDLLLRLIHDPDDLETHSELRRRDALLDSRPVQAVPCSARQRCRPQRPQPGPGGLLPALGAVSLQPLTVAAVWARNHLIRTMVCKALGCEPDWLEKIALGMIRPRCKHCRQPIP